ncbi:hypothetical protein K502DRAFT_57256 [Neoconidiobolus thromboides FSU 785]|nr:hypothetical protein K502DRAFT_57256 [Neoconidiobolus thromboides FSU 785]
MIVSSTIWPFSARRELRKLIASLLADMGMSFGKVAALCMSSNTTTEWKELQSQINLCNRKLQKRILSAKSLHLFALDEPRLKGPFQAPVYSEQIRILQDVLDQLVAMTGAVSQLTPDVQKTVIFPFNSYRKFMVSSVILYFYVLSGALRSKMPLPPYPPPIHAIRYQLMLKTRSALIKKFKKNSYNTLPLHKSILERSDEFKNEVVGSHLELNTTLNFDQKNLHEEFNHIYWYTYMAGLVRLFEDVELLGHNIAGLVGEISIPVKEHIVTFSDDEDDD